jgi:hypothetical protein
LAVALDRELAMLDRHLHGRTAPEGLDAERASLLLVRAQERRRQAFDQVSRGGSLQHGHGLVQAVARGKHPAVAYEEGRRMSQEGLIDEFQEQRRIRYLESLLPGLRAAGKPVVDGAADVAEKD